MKQNFEKVGNWIFLNSCKKKKKSVRDARERQEFKAPSGLY